MARVFVFTSTVSPSCSVPPAMLRCAASSCVERLMMYIIHNEFTCRADAAEGPEAQLVGADAEPAAGATAAGTRGQRSGRASCCRRQPGCVALAHPVNRDCLKVRATGTILISRKTNTRKSCACCLVMMHDHQVHSRTTAGLTTQTAQLAAADGSRRASKAHR